MTKRSDPRYWAQIAADVRFALAIAVDADMRLRERGLLCAAWTVWLAIALAAAEDSAQVVAAFRRASQELPS